MPDSERQTLYNRVYEIVYDPSNRDSAGWMIDDDSGKHLSIGWKGRPPTELINQVNAQCAPNETAHFVTRLYSINDLTGLAAKIHARLKKADAPVVDVSTVGPGDDLVITLIRRPGRDQNAAESLALRLAAEAHVAVTIEWIDRPTAVLANQPPARD